MSLRPDTWEIDIYFLTEEDDAILDAAATLTVVGEDDSVLASGKIEEVYTHIDGGKEITSVMIVDGMAFWSSTVSFSLAKGNSIQDAIKAVARNCSAPADIATIQAVDKKLLRGQAFHGKTVGYISTLAKSINARAYFVRNGLYVVGKNVATDTIELDVDDLSLGVARSEGAVIIRLRMMRGYPVGILVTMPGESSKYRLLCQSVHADNRRGAWRTELILVNEDEILTEDDWGGG